MMLIFLLRKGFPAPIGMLIFGITLSLFSGGANGLMPPFFPIQKIGLSIPPFSDFIQAFFLLVIPQLPLTLGNAVVGTKDVALKYFGEKAKRVTSGSLSISMGVTNIVAGLSGGMPVCHGSGGLTAHYSFGARTGGACIIMGGLCLALSLIFGNRAIEVFRLIPLPILGIMLFYVGIRHGLLVTDLKDKKELLLAFGIGIISLLTQNLAVGFSMGIIAYILPNYLKRKIRRRGNKI